VCVPLHFTTHHAPATAASCVAPALQLPWQHPHHLAAAGRLSTASTAQQRQPHLAHMQRSPLPLPQTQQQARLAPPRSPPPASPAAGRLSTDSAAQQQPPPHLAHVQQASWVPTPPAAGNVLSRSCSSCAASTAQQQPAPPHGPPHHLAAAAAGSCYNSTTNSSVTRGTNNSSNSSSGCGGAPAEQAAAALSCPIRSAASYASAVAHHEGVWPLLWPRDLARACDAVRASRVEPGVLLQLLDSLQRVVDTPDRAPWREEVWVEHVQLLAAPRRVVDVGLEG
jgi:hypothetical protein